MFKSLRTTDLLAHRLPVPAIYISILILIFSLFCLLPAAMGQESNVVEEAQKQVRSWWANSPSLCWRYCPCLRD